MSTINTQATIQKDYVANMIMEMKEAIGGQLDDLGEMRNITGAESTFFNRSTGGIAVATAPSMFGQTDVGTGGATSAIELKPAFAYANDKKPDIDILVSSVDYKGWIPRELARQLEVNKDEKVLIAMAAEKANMEQIGVAATALTSQVETIIGAAKLAILNAGLTPDSRKFVRMIMNRETYRALFTTDIAINNDFVQLSGMSGDSPNGEATFYGCKATIIKQASTHLLDGEIYFVPSMTLGYATWAGADNASATYYPDDNDSWHFTAKKSFGVAVLEAESIGYFQSTVS